MSPPPTRFPIPDLRDQSDCAWWKRSLRDEILHLELLETEFRTVLGNGKPFQMLLLQCRELHSKSLNTLKEGLFSVYKIFISNNICDLLCENE